MYYLVNKMYNIKYNNSHSGAYEDGCPVTGEGLIIKLFFFQSPISLNFVVCNY